MTIDADSVAAPTTAADVVLTIVAPAGHPRRREATIEIGLTIFQTEQGAAWGPLMAAACLARHPSCACS